MTEIDIAATWHLIRTAGVCVAIFGAGLLGTAIVVHVGDWLYRRKHGDSPQE